jgi:hypothetical protein
MSLVIELEEKQKQARRKLLETMARYLGSLNIKDAALVDSDEEIPGFGGSYREPVIQLKGENIDRIRLHTADSFSCGSAGAFSRFLYEIALNKDTLDKTEGKLNAKTKIIRKKSILGIPAGEITDIKWAGNDLAQMLNQDSTISKIVLNCSKTWKNIEFQVQAVSPAKIQILSPVFVDIDYIQGLYSSEHKEKLEDCIFGFTICNKIAQHIRKLIG